MTTTGRLRRWGVDARAGSGGCARPPGAVMFYGYLPKRLSHPSCLPVFTVRAGYLRYQQKKWNSSTEVGVGSLSCFSPSRCRRAAFFVVPHFLVDGIHRRRGATVFTYRRVATSAQHTHAASLVTHLSVNPDTCTLDAEA
jgi:hypothetical protein